METLVIEVATDAELNARILWAAERDEPQPPGYFFETEEDLLDALTANRFAILKALAGTGPIGVRELARRVGRDVRAVHADAQRLAGIGLIEKSADGKLLFPYDAFDIRLGWRAAA